MIDTLATIWRWFVCRVLSRHECDDVVVVGHDPETDDAWKIRMSVCRSCGHVDTIEERTP